MPKFSVIVPVYKVEQYIEACIGSVLKQSFGDFELILVDDGSPDRSPEICDRYAVLDSRIRVVHKKNGGVASARNQGVELAQGDYLVFVDGDDWIPDNCLEHYTEVLDSYDPDLVCGYYVRSSEERTVACRKKCEAGYYDRCRLEKEIFPILIEGEDGTYFASSLCGKAYRRSLYVATQKCIDHRVKIAEDYASTVVYLYHCRSMYLLDQIQYCYRVNDESVTMRPHAFEWDGPELVAQHLMAYIDTSERDFQAQVYRNTVHLLFNVAVSQFNRREPYSAVRKDILNRISSPYYAEAIRNCSYKHHLSGQAARWCLRHRIVFPMYLYCCLKNRL